MSDARLPTWWLNDRSKATLSDAEFRGLSYGLMWCVTNRTDGVIAPEDLELIPFLDAAIVAGLAKKGELVKSGSGWQVECYMRTQTSRAMFESIANKKVADRERKARERAASATHVLAGNGAGQPTVPSDVHSDVRGDVRPDDAVDSQGKASASAKAEARPGGRGVQERPKSALCDYGVGCSGAVQPDGFCEADDSSHRKARGYAQVHRPGSAA